MPYNKSTRVTAHYGLERWASVGLAILLVYSSVRNLLVSASRPFWFDEIFTWALAHQPSATAIWSALEHGVDSNPPGFYIIERTVSLVVSHQEIALRLPSIIGFCCILACLFVLVKKRSGSTVALCCAALPLITVLSDTYAVEARPYALIAACISLAMLCYQHAPSRGWMTVMAVSLAVSQFVHYYTVFALVPFGIAECAAFFNTRRVRLGVWLALAGGFLPFLLCWPLLREYGRLNRSHFWAKPSLLDAGGAYGWYFSVPYALGFGIAGVCAFGILATIMSTFSNDEHPNSGKAVPLEENILTLSMLGLPFLVFLVTKIGHSGMAHRYSLPAILGVLVSVGYLLPKFGRRAVASFAVFLCFTLIFQEARFWHAQIYHRSTLSPAASLEAMVNSTGYVDLAIVVSDGLDYVPIAHYASPESAKRIMALVDAPEAIAYSGSDTVDQDLLAMQPYLPLKVYDFSTFTATHPRFLLYSTNQSQFDWWPSRLVKEGYLMSVLAVDGDRKLYLVNPASTKETAFKRD